jgi:hypothetical protein
MPGEYEAVLALVAGGQGNAEASAVKVPYTHGDVSCVSHKVWLVMFDV